MSTTRQHRSKPDILRDLLSGACVPIAEPWDLSSAQALDARGFPSLYARPWNSCTASSLQAQVVFAGSLNSLVDVPIITEFHVRDLMIPAVLAGIIHQLADAEIAGFAIAGYADQPLLAADILCSCSKLMARQSNAPLVFGVVDPLVMGDLPRAVQHAESYSHAGADGVILKNTLKIDEIKQFVDAISPTPVIVELNENDYTRIIDLSAINVRGAIATGALAFSALSGDEEAVDRLSDKGSATLAIAG
jgi:2-methylisocitrate lyase-like PEP mutase family enzyme